MAEEVFKNNQRAAGRHVQHVPSRRLDAECDASLNALYGEPPHTSQATRSSNYRGSQRPTGCSTDSSPRSAGLSVQRR